ncbi:hypothetical protein ACJJTC_015563 [Scirpophaga incertulas]
MNGINECKIIPTICRNHSSRTDRECFRTCPSKLSKKELEELYFTLLDNNIKLKRTLNSQEETIKLLSTKLQRMAMLQKSFIKEPKDCCAHNTALVNHQKEKVENLKILNERLSEKIRVLNMRLCSAKQLSRRNTGPALCCTKCFASLSGKNSSISMINTKRSNNVGSCTVSSNCLDKENVKTKAVDTQTDIDVKVNEDTQSLCQENKCSILKEELQQKIYDLQQELEKTKKTFSNRMSSLNEEFSKMSSDNQKLRAESVAREFEVQENSKLMDKLGNKLRDAEARSSELAIQLSVEKRKVSELETRIKVFNTTNSLTKAIENQLNITNQCKIRSTMPPEVTNSLYDLHTPDKTFSRLEVSPKSVISDMASPQGESKTFDDSGYADQTLDDDHHKKMQHSNKALIEKILLLQNELSALETSTNTHTKDPELVKSYSKEIIQYEENGQIGKPDSFQNTYDVTVKSTLLEKSQTTTSVEESGFTDYEKILEADSDRDSDASNRSYIIERHNSLTIEKGVVEKFKKLIRSKDNVSKKSDSKEDITVKSADKLQSTSKNRKLYDISHVINITAENIKITTESDISNTNKSDYLMNNIDDLHTKPKITDDKNVMVSIGKEDKAEIPSKAVGNGKHAKSTSFVDTPPHVANQRRSLTYSRDTSPDDTDNEISSMTDLPCEKDRVNSDEWSPGEERPTITCSETYTTDNDYGSLSEGELPQVGNDRRMSSGETRDNLIRVESRGVHGMQDTLQAIDNELKRCHQLLRSQPPQGTRQQQLLM